MKIADRINSLLNQRNWTAYKLAQEADIPQSTISNILNRPSEPTVSTMEVICKGFGITLSEFFAEGSDPVSLSDEQKQVLDNWAKLSEEQRKMLLGFLRAL